MEEQKIPTLTLTPDLDTAQPAVKEPDLLQKAEAAPEAGPELSALSPEEQQAVTAFAGQIDLTNANQVLQYGALSDRPLTPAGYLYEDRAESFLKAFTAEA